MSTTNGGLNIVTNGLVLYLDAANNKSYVSGSTKWNDISRTQTSGSLINGPTYNSLNGGSIVLDGTNDYVDCGTNTNLQGDVGTTCCWIKTSSPGSNYRGIIVKHLGWGLFTLDGIYVTYDWGNSTFRSTGINISTGLWTHLAMSFTSIAGTPSNNALLYLNGSLVLTTTVKKATPVTTLVLGAGAADGTIQNFNGNISQAFFYNRVLSTTEIQQNYNTTKTRFGL